jgi:hypothetical protein
MGDLNVRLIDVSGEEGLQREETEKLIGLHGDKNHHCVDDQ